MTSSTDTTQHPDVSEISDLNEGLLSPSRTAVVRRHIDGCPLCADVRTSLEEIRGLLGTLPGPPRMPADIAGRIDAALAAEALLDATTPDADDHVSRETAPAPQKSPATAPAGSGGDRPAGRPRAATGPGRPGKAGRRRTAALGAAFGAVALGLSLFFVQGGVQTLSGDSGDKRSDAAVSDTAASRFDGEPVETQVQALLQPDATLRAPKDGSPESMSAEGGNTPKRTLAAAIPACVKAGTGHPDAPLAFQKGDYQGTAAYLLVLPDRADPTQVQAFVLDASCADGGGADKAKVLLTDSYPRS
ncbi:hypothetical protein ACWGIN_16915 [Streptomyces sp. NPDC054861]